LADLTLEEAKALSKVFGELDEDQQIILLLFDKPKNKHEACVQSKSFPKQLRISQASLYRKVDSLCDLLFLEIVDTGKFVRGTLRATVNYYQRTLKGILAAYIFAYALLKSKTPQAVIEKLEINSYITALESAQADLFIDFLRWHKNRGDDLSRVKIDMNDLVLNCLHYVLDKPDRISETDIERIAEKMKEYGLNLPKIEPARIRELLLNSKKPLEELTNSIYASVGDKWKKTTSGDSTK
jgi:hypothetical protein